MMTDAIVAEALAPGSSTAASSAAPGAALKFQQAYSQAVARLDGSASAATNVAIQFSNGGLQAAASSSQLPGILNPLLNLNVDSARLATSAGAAEQAELKPSELMMLTMRSHEFLFNCELVANVANRSSDGLQQLFRQQS